MKRILKKESAVVGLADGSLSSDGKLIYEAENLKVGLFNNEKGSNYRNWNCILFGE